MQPDDHALYTNSLVKMDTVFPHRGSVMVTMTVGTGLMNCSVTVSFLAPHSHGNAFNQIFPLGLSLSVLYFALNPNAELFDS